LPLTRGALWLQVRQVAADIATLIDHQAAAVDQVAVSIDATAYNVERGAGEIERARARQRRVRMDCCSWVMVIAGAAAGVYIGFMLW
jgi:t-SNARE complex subunit (syntaxin)